MIWIAYFCAWIYCLGFRLQCDFDLQFFFPYWVLRLLFCFDTTIYIDLITRFLVVQTLSNFLRQTTKHIHWLDCKIFSFLSELVKYLLVFSESIIALVASFYLKHFCTCEIITRISKLIFHTRKISKGVVMLGWS